MPPKTSTEGPACRQCGRHFSTKGITNHQTSCVCKNISKNKDSQFAAQLKVQQRKAWFGIEHAALKELEARVNARTVAGPSGQAPLHVQIPERPNIAKDPGMDYGLFNSKGLISNPDYLDYHSPQDELLNNDDADGDPNRRAQSPVEAGEPEIKRAFHPHSKRPPQFQSFQDFRCNATPEDFTLASQRELDELWTCGSWLHINALLGTITVRYKNENKTYDTHTRPLWDWARSLIQDPRLASSCVWDAEKAYNFDGETYVRFYQEPWTADAFWAAQSSLPDNPAAKPVCYVIYADKSKLSSFGTQKGYAVVARLANVVIETRNSTQFGGGQVVGHQPINAFWKIKRADPHEALSFDPLHADDGGFWGSHLFKHIKLQVNELGREAICKIDEQYAAFPRWRGLNHFESVMNTTFNDGSKHEDVAKMMLFFAHNVLVDEPGLLLLQGLRSYLELRTAFKFEVHTSDTLAVGRNELLTLDSTMKQYIAACEGTEIYGDKDWNVPKFHSRSHAFDDIEKKGASRNFGTKTSESMHGAIRKTYLRLTNFKDLVKHDHRRTVATYIRDQIEALNEDPFESPEDMESSVLSNIDIGSKLKPVSFATLEQDMSHDTPFQRFRVKFGIFITQFLKAHKYNVSDGKPLRFDGPDTILPFQFLKIHYESMSDWKWTADYLRCNPKFHGHPRYDYVLVKTTDKPIFAQLLYMFSCMVENKSHPFALVLPLDAPTGDVKRKDKLLRFHRVRAQARKNSEFISLHSIIRGAVLVADSDKAGDFLVFDVVDGDISLRLKNL
ncbi:hypothetical protein B0H13DRAFT_1853765 [Mycena leptocephala]|nr:hypothetical protein B0H13DRAFT_1853765 [Mycena leptocephala]